MKKSVVVVEGKNDKARLLAIFPEMNIVTTNGSEISQATLEMLENLAKEQEIILMLDPDYPGERIRAIINERIPNCVNVFVPKKEAIDYRKQKVGIEHMSKESLIEALGFAQKYEKNVSVYTLDKMYDLGLVGKPQSAMLREYVAQKLHLGNPNGKTLMKRLNLVGIAIEELRRIINEKDC